MNRALITLVALTLSALSCADDANRAPSFSGAPERLEARVGQLLDVSIPVSDPDGDALTLSVADGPPAAKFEASFEGGRLTWSPQGSDAGTDGREHALVLMADDGQGGVATHEVIVAVQPPDGVPEFTTSNQRILDLAVDDTLVARVGVKDDDSLEVSLTLTEAPDGMSLDQDEPKSGVLVWTPTGSQIAEQLVWSATIVADDGTGGVATQELSVILVGVSTCMGGCACEPPTIEHEPLADQEGEEDYLIEAVITDRESAIQEATLFWTLDDPEDRSNYRSEAMRSPSQGRFIADIPNPVVGSARVETVSYFICAVDDDDSGGDTCDSARCLPESGAFQFEARPIGGGPTCEPDLSEPDDVAEEATLLAPPETFGPLSMCGDDDHLAVELLTLDTVLLELDRADLEMELLGPDWQTVVARGEGGELLYTAEDSGFYVLRVPGDGRAQGDYQVTVDACINDFYEPNDTTATASDIGDGFIFGGALCLGEVDRFRVPVADGGGLIFADVQITTPFEGSVEGVAAVTLLEPGGATSLAEGIGEGDTIQLSREVVASGEYIVEIRGLARDRVAPEYDALITVD